MPTPTRSADALVVAILSGVAIAGFLAVGYIALLWFKAAILAPLAQVGP